MLEIFGTIFGIHWFPFICGLHELFGLLACPCSPLFSFPFYPAISPLFSPFLYFLLLCRSPPFESSPHLLSFWFSFLFFFSSSHLSFLNLGPHSSTPLRDSLLLFPALLLFLDNFPSPPFLFSSPLPSSSVLLSSPLLSSLLGLFLSKFT